MIMTKDQMRRIMDGVVGYVSGCPDAAVMAAIESSTNDFIRDIGGIKDMFGPVPLHGLAPLRVNAPYAGRIGTVDTVIVGDNQLSRNAYRVVVSADGSAGVFIYGGGIPAVTRGSLATVLYSWFPGERTTQLPQQWFDANIEPMEHAAIAHLCSQIGQPWGNEAIAKMYADEYAKNVSDCILQARRNENSGGSMSFFDRNEPWCPGL